MMCSNFEWGLLAPANAAHLAGAYGGAGKRGFTGFRCPASGVNAVAAVFLPGISFVSVYEAVFYWKKARAYPARHSHHSELPLDVCRQLSPAPLGANGGDL